jgi:hypothetical protein
VDGAEASDAHFTCVCRSIFIVRFFSTNRRSRGSMAFPHTAQITGAGFLNHITSSHQVGGIAQRHREYTCMWPRGEATVCLCEDTSHVLKRSGRFLDRHDGDHSDDQIRPS